MTQGQIIMAILAIVNAWALLLAKAWLDRRATATVIPEASQPRDNDRFKVIRNIRWFIFLSLALPTLGMLYVAIFQPLGRIALFFTFTLTVECCVAFTISFVAHVVISQNYSIVDALRAGLSRLSTDPSKIDQK